MVLLQRSFDEFSKLAGLRMETLKSRPGQSAFSSTITKGWSKEDRAKFPAAFRANLSDVEKSNASIEIVSQSQE